MEFDKCIFCKRELQELMYRLGENGERAGDWDSLNLCKGCAKELHKILELIKVEKNGK